MDTTEKCLGRNLHQTKPPLGCKLKNCVACCHVAPGHRALSYSKRLWVDVWFQRFANLLQLCSTSCGHPMLHHHHICGKVEHEFVSNSLLRCLLLRHVFQFTDNLRAP